MEQKIREDLENSYGIICERATPVSGGWLNRKWQVNSGQATYLIKEFSLKRYNDRKILELEEALQRQMIIEKCGVPCPHIIPYECNALRTLEDHTVYMVMSFCSGSVRNSETITKQQIRDLGSVCGKMHSAFGTLPVEGVRGFPIKGKQVLDSLWKHFNDGVKKLEEDDLPEGYREAVLGQETVLKSLTVDFFENLSKGIGHEDFSWDNILFHNEGVAAVVDFDRNQYGFVRHDIGRALLSFAWKDGVLDVEKVHAFMEGYSEYEPLTAKDIKDALKITWCIEAPWWIHPFLFQGAVEKIVRFRDEVLWLTEHWSEL